MTSSRKMSPVLTRGKACLICRGKKHKCDALKPACGPCIRSGMAGNCVYNTEPVKSALRKLEDKARELEEMVNRLNGRKSITATSDTASSPGFSTGPPTPPPAPYIGFVTGPIILPAESMFFESPSPKFIDCPGFPSPLQKSAKSLQDPFNMLMRQDQLPPQIQSHLINIFLAHRWHYATDFNVPRFLAAAELPQSHSSSVHPALIDAMCLLGCMHSGTSFIRYEGLFLKRTTTSLRSALHHASKLFDFIRAEALLGCYYYVKARGVEAHSLISATIRFAMACQLHEINPDMNTNQNPLLAPPRDLIELGDRIYLFWSLFCIDRSGSLITGLPSELPIDDEKITTPWPCPLEYYIDGRALQVQHKTLASMRYDYIDPYDPNDPFDNVQTFFSKCLHFLNRAATLAQLSLKNGEDHAEEITHTGKSLSRLCDSLTNYRRVHGLYGGNTAHDGVLVLAITGTHAAWIQLLNISAGTVDSAWQQRLEVARQSMQIVREAIAADPASLHLLLGLMWTPVYEVLAAELGRFQQLGDTAGAQYVQGELDELMGALRLLHDVFPFKMDMHVEHLRRFGYHAIPIRL
ncbi:hypothetical protein BOTBODRAFT_49840 [Botryobasidium botryosum FD-172 SS1]|uniref:Zn(2)-C6 fungal-type domain-containing protein n=1 Tax=Botryobasidium botryosum (strain FD-172 SS1) TaxID=930990 RepID=A0A067N2F1_BOTB1|nr:hypothetical protein BOTBODRAFT_49840 [Botryobasidium botryosum FD-172 SS1]